MKANRRKLEIAMAKACMNSEDLQPMAKMYVTAQEVSGSLGISLGKAYQVIRTLNEELRASGYITISGKCSRVYFEEKCYGVKVAGC